MTHILTHSHSRKRNRNLLVIEESNVPTKQRVTMDPKRVILDFMPREKFNINLLNGQGFTGFGLNIYFGI